MALQKDDEDEDDFEDVDQRDWLMAEIEVEMLAERSRRWSLVPLKNVKRSSVNELAERLKEVE